NDSVTRRPRHRQPKPRLTRIIVTLEPVQHQESRRGRAALTVDSVEISRAREAVPTLHRFGLRGKTLPAPRSAALQDRAAGTRRHARTKAVLALPPSNVGLVGAFHEVEEEESAPNRGRGAPV